MESQKNNAIFAAWLEVKVASMFEAASNKSWKTIRKNQLPRQAFLWIEDEAKRTTWHFPYREGADGVDPATGEYRKVGAVNLEALRAISQVMKDTANTPMKIPPEIKSKIDKLFKRYKIGQYAHEAKETTVGKNRPIVEASIAKQFSEAKIDTENFIVENVAILRPTSANSEFPGSKGRKYSLTAMESAKRLVAGVKAYINHATNEDLRKRGGVRDVRETLGYWGDTPHIDENGVLRDNLHYLANHAEWFLPMVEQMSDKIGVSIHAYGEIAYDDFDEMEEVQDLTSMDSVDLVSEPGSTINLFESIDDQNISTEEEELEIKNLTLKDIKEGRPDLISEIAAEVKSQIDEQGAVKTLEAKIAELTEQNTKLAKDLDEKVVAEAASNKETRITELVSESKLNKEFVTDTFKDSLRAADSEDKMKALIEDRKTLVATSGKGVKGMGDESEIKESDGDSDGKKGDEITDDEVVAAFG